MTGVNPHPQIVHAVAIIEARLAAAANVIATAADLDLGGIEREFQALCTAACALEPAERPAAIAEFERLQRALDVIAASLIAARMP